MFAQEVKSSRNVNELKRYRTDLMTDGTMHLRKDGEQLSVQARIRKNRLREKKVKLRISVLVRREVCTVGSQRTLMRSFGYGSFTW